MHFLNRAIVAALKTIAVLGLCGMSLLTVVDAAGRYLLNRPVSGTVELIELLMITVIFSSIPLMTRVHGHITVDSFSHFMSPAVLRAQDRLAAVIAAVVSGFLTWVTLQKARSTADYGDITPLLHIPLAPFVYFMAVLLALDAVYQLINLFSPPGQQQDTPTYD
ncbi:TRAP transporter small permease [Allopusillimonas ginsengisoli]|uniref:TRAP transporter small permease n=1 Tax=Allopusillimonas ginsengisoli TaxID=453575 RepID=UPI0010C1B904|nr:TRAP transporter small permease [Allopusillimonas ginsengisoli]